jgi:hypothetical protein
MPNESYTKTLRKLRIRSKAVEANLGEVPQLRDPCHRLNTLLARADELLGQQAALAAAKQEVSKELAGVIMEGRRVLAFVDTGLRFHYGSRSEKLVEFGQQPFRGLRRRAVRILGPDGRPVTSDASSEPQE